MHNQSHNQFVTGLLLEVVEAVRTVALAHTADRVGCRTFDIFETLFALNFSPVDNNAGITFFEDDSQNSSCKSRSIM